MDDVAIVQLFSGLQSRLDKLEKLVEATRRKVYRGLEDNPEPLPRQAVASQTRVYRPGDTMVQEQIEVGGNNDNGS